LAVALAAGLLGLPKVALETMRLAPRGLSGEASRR
jgi:hypothetical protein